MVLDVLCLLSVAGESLSIVMEAVGLYDFNPTGSDELSFKKGDVLKVRGGRYLSHSHSLCWTVFLVVSHAVVTQGGTIDCECQLCVCV